MPSNGRPSKLPDDETLRALYWNQGLQPKEIAALYGVSLRTVVGRMRRRNIPRRTIREGMLLSHAKGIRKKGEIETKLRDVLRCPACCWVWRRETETLLVPCPRCGKIKDCRRRKFKDKRPSDPKKLRMLNDNPDHKKRYAKIRRSVLLLVGRGNPTCVNCGCDRPEFLEVNHVNGGGAKEVHKITAGKFYQQIIKLERAVDDLNLLCKVCNALHALELKYGKLPYEVHYREG